MANDSTARTPQGAPRAEGDLRSGGDGPDRDERENPGTTSPNPAAAPAEGSDDTPPPQPGSPEG